ncbi:hypothetical protein [Mycobacterium sp.]|uniref:hypothetical protein n=1 Tax=Mycobacterium sp. TaxID=1785 RepID=UPI003BB0C955
MGWWDHLTQAQGTVIGGGFVLVAAFIAFGTGFLERKRQQRNYHYEEAKRAYQDAVAYAIASRGLHKVPQEERREVVRRLEATSHEGAAQLFLTVPTASAELVDRYTRLAARKSMQELGIPENKQPSMVEPDEDFDTTLEHVRRQLARNLLPLNKHRRDLRRPVPNAAKPPRQLFKLGPVVVRWG